LNSDPDTRVAASGAGSPGNETNYFGSLTRAALRKFQAKYGIVSSGDEATTGYGLLGPKTRSKLQEVFSEAKAAAPAAPSPAPSAAGISAVFIRGLSKGMSNSDIKRLQQLLNSDPDTRVAASGAGSPGNETNYFGSLTEKAVQKFQLKYGVVMNSSDPGYGYVGPKTRAKLQEVFSGQSSAPASQITPTSEADSQSGEEQVSEELEAMIKQLEEQVKALQAELEETQ
jgi:peptidoglycan hydrolase-like protein with peptidoglycan-binding domain